MSITINASIASKDEITLSLGHSSRGIYEGITKYIVYEISLLNGQLWHVNVTVPYPFSQSSGNIILSVGDSHSGDITTTELIIRQDGKENAPFFDPLPRSVETYSGQDVFIDTEAKGSAPITVSFL